MIYLDNGARLDVQESEANEELRFRTVSVSQYLRDWRSISISQGTPTYVARSVSAGAYSLQAFFIEGVPMPLLPDEIRARYEQVHSAEPRYAPYNDANGTLHGGVHP